LAIARRKTQAETGPLLDTSITETQAPGALELDPFAFSPDMASRIGGLGGTGPTSNLEYAFHTAYVEAAAGKATFTARFHNLQAKKGTLVLRVHMVPVDGGPIRLANSERIALNRLIVQDSTVSIRFEGFHDVVFALVGLISGETDATADGLTVTLDKPADPNARPQHVVEARSTAYGNTPLQPAGSLLSTDGATLADPVSQLATAAQLREPVAGGWMARLRPKGNSGVEHWRKVYTLQVLRRYGMLERGAVGLGFEPSPSGVPAALAAMGTSVVAAFPARPGQPLKPEALKKDLSRRAPCDPVSFEENVTARVVSWRRIPEDLINFDFAWSARANEQLYSVAGAVQFIQDVMACLRPGGLAVHTLSYELVPSGRSVPSTDRILLQQGDVERIALALVSRGHEVAQFKFQANDLIVAADGISRLSDKPRTMVGLIARKARMDD
jgi:hypothetical protein